MLYAVTNMKHRTQLYLDEDQYRWLKRQAERAGSLAQVVRDLIDAAREEDAAADADDELIRYLLDEPAAAGERSSTVTDLDHDVYGT